MAIKVVDRIVTIALQTFMNQTDNCEINGMKLKINVKKPRYPRFGFNLTMYSHNKQKEFITLLDREVPIGSNFSDEVEILIDKYTPSSKEEEEENRHLFKSLTPESFQNINPINPSSISQGDYLNKVIRNLRDFMRDPIKVAKNLKYVDEEISRQMKSSNITFDGRELPKYLIMCQSYYMPGRPSEDYTPKKKGHLIDNALLSLERQYGLNQEAEGAFRFIGAVEGKDTVEALTSGNGRTFTEDAQARILLHHGKGSHRLDILAILKAIENGDLDLSLDGQNPSPKDVLTLLLKSKPNIWESVIDNLADNIKYNEQNGNADWCYQTNVCFSLVSPFSFNSLILCFGTDVGLPNLQSAMLDSHYKQMGQMISRVMIESGNHDIDIWKAYDVITEGLGTTRRTGDLDQVFIGGYRNQELIYGEKFSPTKWQGVVTKNHLSDRSYITYTSMHDYINSRKEPEIKRQELVAEKRDLYTARIYIDIDKKFYNDNTGVDDYTCLHRCDTWLSNINKKVLELSPQYATKRTQDGKTPMHTNSNQEIIELLVSRIPEMITWKDNDGKLPMETNPNPEVKEYLRKEYENYTRITDKTPIDESITSDHWQRKVSTDNGNTRGCHCIIS